MGPGAYLWISLFPQLHRKAFLTSSPQGRNDSQEPFEVSLAHQILARDFTDRYLDRSGLKRFAYSADYDSNDPVCDYDRTWWEAKPNRLSAPLGKAVLGSSHHMNGREIDKLFAAPFSARAGDFMATLPNFPVALINGHDIDLQAALALLSASMGLARADSAGSFQQNLEAMIRVSHGVATRGLAPIVIGRPRLRPRLTFIRLQRLIVNPHLSFPINKEMIESGIPQDFRSSYNARLRAESIAVARAPTDHPKGLRTLWSISPGGTPDRPGTGEHEGKLITKSIEPATLHLVNEMGCGLIPVYTRFGKGRAENRIELGDIVPPDAVTDSTVPNMMADIAAFRRRNGEPHVFYEEELALG
ncbi:MAG: hypothetical protein JHD02_00650 [Thermoleophilaceae bacterium]|nr:hypothetical protein [Thermoleophilaceae bacterium]